LTRDVAIIRRFVLIAPSSPATATQRRALLLIYWEAVASKIAAVR
jgi:hypothetical protein